MEWTNLLGGFFLGVAWMWHGIWLDEGFAMPRSKWFERNAMRLMIGCIYALAFAMLSPLVGL